MFKVIVFLENRCEYVPFYSAWAACVMAEKWAGCIDVEKVWVLNTETGEVIDEYEHYDMPRDVDF